MSHDGIELKLTGKTWKLDFFSITSEVLKGVIGAAIAAKTGGVSLALAPNAISGLFGALKGIKREEPLESKAWVLVLGGLLFAIEQCVSEALPENVNLDPTNDLSEALAARIASRTYAIAPDFYSEPNKLDLLDDVAHELSSWFYSAGITIKPKTAKVMLSRWFPTGLHRTWLKDHARFESLRLALGSPFAPALEATQQAEAYLQYLEEEFTMQPLIGQDEDAPNPIRLSQVFVPLRAFFEESNDQRNIKQ